MRHAANTEPDTVAVGEADDNEAEVGRRGGAFLSTTGSFTLSSGSNTAGNDESLLFGEDLGEDVGATADDLDAAADHFLKLAGERKNKAKRKREAEQTAATSEVAELGDGAG